LKTSSRGQQLQSLTLSLIDSQPMKNTAQVAKFKVLLNHLVFHLTLDTDDYWHLSVHQLEQQNHAQIFALLQHCRSDDSIILQIPETIIKSLSMSDVNVLSIALISIWDDSVTKKIAVTSNGAAGDVLFVDLFKVITLSCANLVDKN